VASFTERVEARVFGDEYHRFLVSDDGDLYTLREMYEMGEGRSVYLVDIRSGVKVLDIGAHKGIFSVWAAKQGAAVTAYEPDPKSYDCLVRNLRENQVIAETKNCGVWSRRDTLPFYADYENSIACTFIADRVGDFDAAGVQLGVKVISLDEALGNKPWDIVKIDAEGSEYEMISSAKRLGQIGHLALEWHREGDELDRMIEKLSQYFEVPKIDPNWRILSMRRK